MVNALQLIAT